MSHDSNPAARRRLKAKTFTRRDLRLMTGTRTSRRLGFKIDRRRGRAGDARLEADGYRMVEG